MAINFKEIAQNATTLSDIMNGRTKVDKQDGEYNILDFDFVDVKGSSYVICAVSETEFINGGFVLTKIFTDIVREFDGDITGAREEFRKAGGFKVRLAKSRTKNGNTITTVEIL